MDEVLHKTADLRDQLDNYCGEVEDIVRDTVDLRDQLDELCGEVANMKNVLPLVLETVPANEDCLNHLKNIRLFADNLRMDAVSENGVVTERRLEDMRTTIEQIIKYYNHIVKD